MSLLDKIIIGMIAFLICLVFAAAAFGGVEVDSTPPCIESYDGEPEQEEVIEPPCVEPELQVEELYPEAVQIWYTLTSWGFTPETTAGILGNMMAEVGGGTLDLSYWNASGSNGYGLIQWIGNRRIELETKYSTSPTIEEQLLFMFDELHGTNGVTRQVTNKQYDLIIYAETPEDAAYAFAIYYERCASQYREMRKGYARTAYDYFMR